MISEQDKIKVRTIKNKIEQDSGIIENIVDQLVAKYNADLDNFMAEIKGLIDSRDDLTDFELEKIALKVPVYMYFSVSGVENLGIQYDNAKARRQSEYNTYYMDEEGTIKDKQAAAELKVIPEQVMEIAFQRAYKKLKAKIDTCEQLCLSIRKIIGKRTQDLTINKYESQFNDVDRRGDK